MKSPNEKISKKAKGLEEILQSTDNNQNVPAQKDGFRYDYTDNADLNEDNIK